MRTVLPLTDLRIRKSRPRDKRYKLFDGGGLYLEVLPGGAKSWRVLVRVDGKERRPTLGAWPAMSIKEAREAAFKLRSGAPPSKSSMTLAELSGDWMDVALKRMTEKEAAQKRYFVNNYILPPIGRLPLD